MRYYKLFTYFGVGLLVIGLVFGGSELKAENLTITLDAGGYQIITVDEGLQMIKMEGFGNLLVPGKPMLPAKSFMIALPPGAEVSSVTTNGTGAIEVEGRYKLRPAPPLVPTGDRKAMAKQCLREWQQNYDVTYSSDQVYPENTAKYLGTGGLRKYTFIRVAYFPFAYYPQSGRLAFTPSLMVSIDYSLPPSASQRTLKSLSDTKGDKRASRWFVNYSQAEEWYLPPEGLKSPKQPYDYVIITTDALTGAVSSLVTWKEMIGYDVNVVTTSWIESNYSGLDLEQKIRNFLIDKYIDWGIEYVLLAGNIDIIPMRHCYPDPSNHNPNSIYCPPTDYYYADLTGDWDSDGDGYYGEYEEDNVDFVPEVWVGRIPWSSAATLSDICQKLVDFEADTAEWKNRALLLGGMVNYEDQDHTGYPKTDDATLMEEMIADILSGWSYTTMYEKGGLDPSAYSCDSPLTHDNVVNEWSTGQYGIVNWSGHGNSSAGCRMIWSWDDGDNVPETETPDEMAWEDFISRSDVSSLDDDHPSIIFANACSNGWPEAANLASDLLRNGSAGIVSATRGAWAAVGWWDEYAGGCASIDYFFFDYMINDSEKVGEALFDSKVFYANNFFYPSWEWRNWQNMFDFCLYGDPALVREGVVYGCCNHDGIRGDVDLSSSVNVADLAYLVSYLFDQPPGPAPPCFEEADVDASLSINVADLAYLVSYLFDQPPGPAPLPCP